jgi:DNA-binding CsgD family transcriptional regulator
MVAPAARRGGGSAAVSGWARNRVGRTSRPGQLVAIVALAVILGSSIAWFMERRVTELMLADLLARARDEVELGIVPRVTQADFEPPYSAAKLDALDAKLDPVLDRARQPGSGVVRVNLFARDGTVVYSDLASLRGQVISPLADPPLATALSGTASADVTPLTRQEDADLRPRYDSALEAYVPCVLEGRVIGVFELDTEAGPLGPMRWAIWSSIGLAFAVLVIGIAALGRGAGSAALAGRAGELTRSNRPPPVIRTGLVRFNPGGEAVVASGAQRSANGAVAAPVTPSLECWLSRRETEVLQLLATNRTYRDIANELSVSEETVRSHVKSILHKLGQPDRTRAVAAAVQAGILRS